MKEEFWKRRWQNNQIGFHAPVANPFLQQYWPNLGVAEGAQVLVPLCGKSLDLVWLASQGLRVMGVELVEQAVEDFFREQQLQPQVRQQGVFTVYQADAVEIWCGDIFALTADDVRECAALYDRAALIAFPPAMREAYALHLGRILPDACRGLLVSLDYEQELMDGPPFSVPDQEVQRLLGERWQPQLLHVEDCIQAEQSARFVERGLRRMDERVYALRRG